MCTARFWFWRAVGYIREEYPDGRVSGWVGYTPPKKKGRGTHRYPIFPPPQKEHKTRYTLPLERTWDQDPGRELPPEIPYPL